MSPSDEASPATAAAVAAATPPITAQPAPSPVPVDVEVPPSEPAPAPQTPAEHLAQGHSIIASFEARAQALAANYPVVKVLMPAIASCLHDLLSHLAAAPDASPLAKDLASLGNTAVDDASRDLLTPPVT